MAVLTKFPRRFLWFLIALIVLLLLIRVSAPVLIEQGIISWFDRQNLEAEIGDINIDLSDGSFALTGLKAINKGQEVLNLNHFSTRWSWSAFFDSKARIFSINIDGLAFDIDQRDENLIVAGIDINKLTQPEQGAEAENSDAEQEPVDWQVLLDELKLSNFDICYRHSSENFCSHFDNLSWQGDLMVDLAKLENPALPMFAEGSFVIDQLQVHDNALKRDLAAFNHFSVEGINIDSLNSVAIAALKLSEFDSCIRLTDEDYCSNINEMVWQGSLKADLSNLDDAPPPLNANGRFAINKLQVHDNIRERDLLSFEQFQLEAINVATLESVAFDELILSKFDACYGQSDQDYCSHFDNLSWQGKLQANLSKLDGSPPPLNAEGNFEINALQVRNNALGRDLASFDQMSVEAIQIATLDSISFRTLSLDALALLKRDDDELSPQISRFEKIQLDTVMLKTLQQLDIGQLNIKDHELLLVNKADKTLELNEWLPPQSTEEEPATARAEEQPGEFQYAIKKLIYETDKSIHYRDLSLKEPFIVDLNHIVFEVENIDSNKPDQNSNIKYSAQYAEHGKISLEGTAKPLNEKPSFDMVGQISGLDLRDISPFTSEAIGHRIKSGQLDADLKLIADKSILNSEIDLKLHHFELTALSPQDEEKLNADFGYPLNSSLSLLKDDSNKIELNIPITGDLENPDFDANDALTQAASSAITSAIISYYTPFGLVMAVEGLIDLATALNFEPVNFAAGDKMLASVEQENLNNLVQLLNEKPGIHLTICPLSNTPDRLVILPDTATIAIDQLKLETEQLNILLELGEARAAAVKQYLVDQKIDASRLVLCTPEHIEGDGLSGVELSI